MSRVATFDNFNPDYKLTGVRLTNRELGQGASATVLELEYMGVKCAGKKIHDIYLREGVTNDTVCRFEEECRLLSQVRHPNIVQFLGVHFQQGVRVPILVMEFLPTNLTSCIDQYGILPKEISYSILHDVALGLCYLHSQPSPILHRDLSSNNVLLTPNMTAKISDLGMARILNLTPLQISGMTPAPGTPAFMPPEVMVANPKYNTSIDEFSYGIIMIHIFSGKWPEPQVGPIHAEPDGRMIPLSEAERRKMFLDMIGDDHPLMDLIRKCIHNYPQSRANASEIVERLAEMVLQFPTSSAAANRLEMLRQILQGSSHTRSHSHLRATSTNTVPAANDGGGNLRAKGGKNKHTASFLHPQDTSRVLGDCAPERKRRRRMNGRERDIHITWQQCAELPTRLFIGDVTAISGKIYCGGGGKADKDTDDDVSDHYIVYCNDLSQHEWTTLPPLPVKYFGLGQVNGKLVAVGGKKSDSGEVTNVVYTYDGRSLKWKQTIPPMPTVRCFPGVLSLQSALVVAGGCSPLYTYTSTVELFRPDTSQWYKAASLRMACCSISLVAIGNTCYALGGFNDSCLNQALYVSVDDLLGNAVPANQTTHSGSSDMQPAWKALPNTPTYQPTAAVLAGNLFAIGGDETYEELGSSKNVYMYSPSINSWIYVSDLPAPRTDTVVAVLSSTEILVIGGNEDDNNMDTVYKGTLS